MPVAHRLCNKYDEKGEKEQENTRTETDRLRRTLQVGRGESTGIRKRGDDGIRNSGVEDG